ncbi:MAG: malto-oligosyltrehalose synthase [Byssovorax sp.]
MQIPVATYRLQLNRDLGFGRALGLVDYLHDLGVGACYTSPLLEAMPGSNHGYDVVDHGKINRELGSEAELVAFATALSRRGMGVILDVVPNHMCVAGSRNRWWRDVLENGPSSPYARFFDIDWQPPKVDLRAKVLLPILGDQFGCVLEDRAIQIRYEDEAFVARYYETSLPIAPRTWHLLLEPALGALTRSCGGSDPSVLELESILTALRHLPLRTDTEEARVRERLREKEIIKRRLRTLLESSPQAKRAVDDAITTINGVAGEPSSVDGLEDLLADQGYRPSFWRVACDEINYRRFFDINELAAIRVEESAVFRAVHEVPLRLARQGLISGLRIDHVDGLFAPAQYLADLQRAFAPLLCGPGAEPPAAYIVVEKILGPGERLPAEWPVQGTTGYAFTALVTGVLVDPDGLAALSRSYESFTSRATPFEEIVYESKKLVLKTAMSSELTVLARKVDVISEQHRTSRDFTLSSLQEAVSELIACFPVYRSYVGPEDDAVTEADQLQIERAVREAKSRNPATSRSIFDFLRGMLLLRDPPGLDEAERAARRDFVLRFQQLTGPVMAKGFEDTAFYRYFPLAALNEVGGGHHGAISVEAFHAGNLARSESTPHDMSATATHDTKRGEDTRARLCVLSEVAEPWRQLLEAARQKNQALKTEIGGVRAPDANDEYLLYQTILGAWPAGAAFASADFVARIQQYMSKALREAKVHTSWINPNEPYESAVQDFIAAVLDPAVSAPFLDGLGSLRATMEHVGWLNSLSQLVLKVGSPGVPDFYQGSELWDLSLVDPDNRRPVDFEHRKELLASIRREAEADPVELIERLTTTLGDGRIKMYVTSRALAFRKARRELFERGTYEPVPADGAQARSVISFARRHEGRSVIIAAGRLFTSIAAPPELPLGARWGTTRIEIAGSSDRYRDALTGRTLQIERDGPRRHLPVARVFAHLPVAILEAI